MPAVAAADDVDPAEAVEWVGVPAAGQDPVGAVDDAGRREEERHFLTNPKAVLGDKVWATLEAIGATLDLDFAGIDFSVLQDGRLLLFEANPTMLVHPEEDPLFSYKNAAVQNILDAFDRMIVERIGQN